MNLLQKSLRSCLWVAGRIASRQAANAALFFWLAFMLEPHDLGVATLGVALPIFFLPAVRRGVAILVIRPAELNARTTDTAFALSLAVGLFISAAVAGFAPFAAEVFDDARLLPLTLSASAIPLLVASSALHEALLEREFRHKSIAIAHALASALTLALVIPATLLGHAIWALVAYNLISFACLACWYWLTSSWRPQRAWSWSEAQAQLRFAAPVMVSQTLANGNQRVVEILIGALLGPAAAAYFRFGGNFTRLMNQALVSPVTQILLPAFARSNSSAKSNLVRALTINAAALFPVFLGVSLTLADLVELAFGDAWEIGGTVGSILCFGVFASLIQPVAYPLLTLKGHGVLTAVLAVLDIAVAAVFVIAGGHFGVLGAASGFVLRGLLTVPVTLVVIKDRLGVPPISICAPLGLLTALSLSMYFFLYAFVAPISEHLPVLLRIFAIATAGFIYYVVILCLALKYTSGRTNEVLVDIFRKSVRLVFPA